jgi:hypothetical protein
MTPKRAEKISQLSVNAVEWLANGERGVSSETLFKRITGVDAVGPEGYTDHPHDPGDFRRCRLLLEKCPELAGMLHKMKRQSPQWAVLVGHWQELCDLMDSETPTWRKRNCSGSASRTYQRMRELFDSAKSKRTSMSGGSSFGATAAK